MIYTLCMALFFIGLYGICCKKNLIKIVLGFIIMDYAVNLFIILIGYRKNGIAPILDKTMDVKKFALSSVDPMPQAMVLTAIVIGLAVTALLVALCVRIYERYGTFDITKIRKLRG
ncbi:MAG: cation:proton antiporter [Elusimicrobia bacterium CG_4_10_14_3_um_filter_49_12_50_7]|nr:MAG: cation:proton antiporter [Elusimicrobia bacterium CG03_land_8_20_14_0_80_50_18]PIX16141.1 MAG: cation:proton antiporter [Elusimicrobia bacterium CG_4_8_14_3_um_filter_50_9]PIY16929.1 MAG: cation:proton antiporter [Elusimicrobia bacterium CG_4_10_14_3_um_filter_49_12_50_7]